MEKKQIYAPIIIPTLCRFEHFKRCVESLAACTFADKTELIIGLDYPLEDSHWEGYRKICDYLKQGIEGFKNVVVEKREYNFGVCKNLRYLVDYVLSKYDCFIYSEDDNEFSPNFLDYINWGLETYKDDKSVLAVCGFKRVEIRNYHNNVFKYPKFNAWGYGIWKDRAQLFQEAEDYALVKQKLDQLPLSIVLSRPKVKWASRYLEILGRKELMDDCLPSLFPNPKMYCIFPTISKVRNWGCDGSGVHCSNKTVAGAYKVSSIDNDNFFIPVIKEDLYQERFKKIYSKEYHVRMVYYLWCVFQFVMYKLTAKILICY